MIDPTFTRELAAHLARRFPGYRLVEVESLAPDTGATRGSTAKATGYGRPLRLVLADERNTRMQLVWRTATPNPFGHDRRADRIASMVLAADDFPNIPRHVRAVELGAIDPEGHLVPLPARAEAYLITTFAPGTIYADDLRRIGRSGLVRPLDLARVDTLARYLVNLHQPLRDDASRYRRTIRDLVGSGEGIFGIVDGFPADTPGAPAHQLHAIERYAAEWRWRIGDRRDRLVRTHGDFHPFNLVFDGETDLAVLDASRGTAGDAADDVTALAVNFVFFALNAPQHWRSGLGALWHRFWHVYRNERRDDELPYSTPPFFAWRALVVCNPLFYPDLPASSREAMLWLATRALREGRLEPGWADELFPSR